MRDTELLDGLYDLDLSDLPSWIEDVVDEMHDQLESVYNARQQLRDDESHRKLMAMMSFSAEREEQLLSESMDQNPDDKGADVIALDFDSDE